MLYLVNICSEIDGHCDFTELTFSLRSAVFSLATNSPHQGESANSFGAAELRDSSFAKTGTRQGCVTVRARESTKTILVKVHHDSNVLHQHCD